MSDYPDYTRAEQIIGSNIQVPIDIQGAYIMMPVDIQAQYITLEIDIVAQSVGNIAVDITAQTLGTLNVNISAASIGNLNINFNAQGAAVYFGGEWNIIQGNGISMIASATNQTFSSQADATRTVTAGKKFYINQVSFNCHAYSVANADLPQMCRCFVYDQTASIFLYNGGGNGGGGLSFPAPIAVAAGHIVQLSIRCEANHACDIDAYLQGWEV